MAEKKIFSVPQKYFIYPLIAISIATFGFGVYLGRMHHTASAKHAVVNQDWQTYVSPDGWSVRHPRDVFVMRDNRFYGYAEEGAFFTTEKSKSTLFSEESIHGSRLQFGVISNPERVPLENWVEQWKQKYKDFCYCTVNAENPASFSVGAYPAHGVYTGSSDYSSYFVFVPVSEDKILWANASTNDQRDPSKWSVRLLKDMLATVKLY